MLSFKKPTRGAKTSSGVTDMAEELRALAALKQEQPQ